MGTGFRATGLRAQCGRTRAVPGGVAGVLGLALLLGGTALARRPSPIPAPHPTPRTVEGPARVLDGDSLVAAGVEIRLLGIDAPEGGQTCRRKRHPGKGRGQPWDCGAAAREVLARLAGSGTVSCRIRARDVYGRALATCRAKGRSLNAGMVRSGYAVSYGGRYRREEQEARAARRGLWDGEFQRPRDWRRTHPPARKERKG